MPDSFQIRLTAPSFIGEITIDTVLIHINKE